MNSRLLIYQAVLVLIAVAVSFYLRDTPGLIAAIYGGAVALLNTFMLTRRVTQAGQIAETNPQRGAYSLYFSAVLRFVFVLIALGIGLGAIKLQAEPLLATFGIAQLAYLLGSRA